MPLPHVPAIGVLIACALEEDQQQTRRVWIDLQAVSDAQQISDQIDQVTGKAADPHPHAWIDEGTYAVEAVRGLGPRLSALSREDADPGLLSQTLADLAAALQMLEPQEVAPFLAWAESEAGAWWLPGYGGADWSAHPPEDVVCSFRLDALSHA